MPGPGFARKASVVLSGAVGMALVALVAMSLLDPPPAPDTASLPEPDVSEPTPTPEPEDTPDSLAVMAVLLPPPPAPEPIAEPEAAPAPSPAVEAPVPAPQPEPEAKPDPEPAPVVEPEPEPEPVKIIEPLAPATQPGPEPTPIKLFTPLKPTPKPQPSIPEPAVEPVPELMPEIEPEPAPDPTPEPEPEPTPEPIKLFTPLKPAPRAAPVVERLPDPKSRLAPRPEPEPLAKPLPRPRPVLPPPVAPAERTVTVAVAVTTPEARQGRALLRLLEHGDGPGIEIAWPSSFRERQSLYRVLKECYGMRLALLDKSGNLYIAEGARGRRWDINQDRFSGFVRQPDGSTTADENRLAQSIRAYHKIGGGVPVRIFPRKVDSVLLGGIHALLGEGYAKARSIRATYRHTGSGLFIEDIRADGVRVPGRIAFANAQRAVCR